MANEAGRRGLIIAALICAALTLAIGFTVSMGVGKSLDREILLAVALRSGRDSDVLISLVQWITWLSNSAQRTAMVVLAAAWLLWKQRRRAALAIMVVPILAGVTNSVLKEIFARARPDIVPHLDAIGNLAYPSGHASNAMAFFLLAALIFAIKHPVAWRSAAVGLAVLVGTSRVLLGVHWPSDVLGGWLWGAAFALIGWRVSRR
ncbi:MAG: phosphatase PAP2 family protein [Pseudomonadota bacterium]